MHPFRFQRAKDSSEALHLQKGKRYLAGGTTLIDLMKLEVERPSIVVDVNQLPWKSIEEKNGEWHVGALATNTELANHREIKKHYQVLSEAIQAGATAQLRNKATVGGNLLQRTRCVYFRDPNKPCNKREPGTGCSALEGHNRNLAILGTSEFCIATNPSDMNVALAALEARVNLVGAGGERSVEIKDFHVLPGKAPHVETVMQENELIRGITLPKLPADASSFYIKLRDRASYEFALASLAVVTTMKAGRVERIRFAMGGVGTKPWRVPSAEKLLEGTASSEQAIRAATAEFLKGAKGYSENSFKIELAQRCLLRGLQLATRRNA